MPSCVVKWCKNNTTSQKKRSGITFHRFPTGNEPWKDDWTRIIRNCRGQEDWSASKSSVVCSIHFDQNVLYTTSKGRRRLVTYATRIKFIAVRSPFFFTRPCTGCKKKLNEALNHAITVLQADSTGLLSSEVRNNFVKINICVMYSPFILMPSLSIFGNTHINHML
ncbi:hypothetical protein ABMA27_008528 [Loxostege sticticalis]|uniref:THAP-type domain-containing protein n=1 Tax=Loxostege sticticalis TaxID=481309 RepID=A0ABR3HBN7_LOXSC